MNGAWKGDLLWRWDGYFSVHGRSRSCEAVRGVSFWRGSVTGSWDTGSLDIPPVSTCRMYLILTSTLALETGPVGRLYPRKMLTVCSNSIRYGRETGGHWTRTSLASSSR